MAREVELILGAPGCGKTTALMDILEEELKLVEPDQIAFVSFTRKGTYEGQGRANELFGLTPEELPYFRTLDSLAFRAGNFSRNDMMKKEDYRKFSELMGMKFTGYYTADFSGTDDKYLHYYTMRKENARRALELEEELDMIQAEFVCTNFDAFKKRRGVVDFGDIMTQFVEADQPLPVRVAIIDEAQDLSALKWRMCRVAFRHCERVYIAGDDDQAIYEWSGADVKNFLAIEHHPTNKVRILDQSYRMRKNILDYAKKISAEIENRVPKEFAPVSDGGKVHRHNTVDEILIRPNETYYLLARNNYHLAQWKEYLVRNAILFYYKHEKSFKEKDFKTIVLYERMRKGIALTEQEEMAVRVYLKDDAVMTEPWFNSLQFQPIHGLFTPDEKIDYYRNLIAKKVERVEPKVMINTIHGVKGGEADNVVLMLDFTRRVKIAMETNPDSEMRTLYVGMTRAKHNLHVIYSRSKYGYDKYLEL